MKKAQSSTCSNTYYLDARAILNSIGIDHNQHNASPFKPAQGGFHATWRHPSQIDLYGEVAAKSSTATVSQTGVTFALQKVTKGLWGRLTADGEKQELLERRQKSLEAYREAAGKQKEDARLLKVQKSSLPSCSLL
jgi:hypothetical protein